MLKEIAEAYRLRLVTKEGEAICPGSKGHLWGDGRKLMVYFGDDGRQRPLTACQKKNAMASIPGLSVTQEAEVEFCGQIPREKPSIQAAVKTLGLKKRKSTFGIPKPFPGSR